MQAAVTIKCSMFDSNFLSVHKEDPRQGGEGIFEKLKRERSTSHSKGLNFDICFDHNKYFLYHMSSMFMFEERNP